MMNRYLAGQLVRVAIVVVIDLAILAVLFALLPGRQLNPRIGANVLQQALMLALAGMGVSLVLVSGHMDLSVGGIAALAGTVMILLRVAGMPMGPALIAGLSVGFIAGLVNGVLVAGLDLSSAAVTVVVWMIAFGAALAATGGQLRSAPLGAANLMPPLAAINLFVLLAGIGALIFIDRTRLSSLPGLRGVTRSEPAGAISLRLYILAVFIVSGLLAAGAGMAQARLLNAAVPSGALRFLFSVLAAVVIGGAPLWRGATRLIGVFLGSAIVQLISTEMQLASPSIPGLQPELVWGTLALILLVIWGAAGWLLDRVTQE